MISRLVLCVCLLGICIKSHASYTNIDTAKAVVLLKSYLDSATATNGKDNIKALEYHLMALDLEHRVIGHLELKSHLHNLLGNSLGVHGMYAESSGHKHIANYYQRQKAKPDTLQIAFTFGGIGSFYLQDAQLDSAFMAFWKAYYIVKKVNLPLFESSACNNLALAHQEAGNFDSSAFYYQKGLTIIKTGPTTKQKHSFKELLYLNYGELLANMGKHRESNEVYLRAVDTLNAESLEYRDSRKLICFFQIANNYLELGQFEDAAVYVDSFQYLNTLFAPILKDQKWHETLLTKQLEIAKNRNIGNSKKLLAELNSVRSKIITLQSVELENTVKALEGYQKTMVKKQKAIHRLEVGSKESELQLSKRNNQLNLLIFFVVGTVILGILIVSFLFFKRKSEMLHMEQQRAELALENKQLQEEKLQIELKAKEEDVLKLALENNRKHEWNSEVIQKLKVLKKENGEDHRLVLRKIEMELRDELHSNEKTDLFHKNVDQINQAFYDKLKAQFPDLTQGEVELCGLIKMKMNGKEIAKLRNISPQSVTKSKQRLRKKLHIDVSTDLVEVIEEITQT